MEKGKHHRLTLDCFAPLAMTGAGKAEDSSVAPLLRNDGVRLEGKGGNKGGSLSAAFVSAALPTKPLSFRMQRSGMRNLNQSTINN